MIEKRDEAAKNTIHQVAERMIAAAVTAPKAHGWDYLEGYILDGEDKARLADHMRDIYRETGADFFQRDAGCVDDSECVVILATLNDPIHLEHCGYCGFEDCADLIEAGGNCAFNVTDLGIAIGSAVSIAADHRIDNRVMFSAGQAALRMDFLAPGVRVCYGIPLSVTSKSNFFDRDPKNVSIR